MIISSTVHGPRLVCRLEQVPYVVSETYPLLPLLLHHLHNRLEEMGLASTSSYLITLAA